MLGRSSEAEAVRFRSAPDSGSESGSWCKSDIYNCIFKFVECIKTRNKYILVNLFSLDIDKEKKKIVECSIGGLRLQFFQFFLHFLGVGATGAAFKFRLHWNRYRLRPAPTGQQ